MRRFLAARGAPAAIVGILALLTAGGAYAIANSRGTNGGGKIHACVQKGTRTLYKAPCKKSDKNVSWNQLGPSPKGPEGTAADFYSRNKQTLTLTGAFDSSPFTTARPGHLLVIKSIDAFTPQCNGKSGAVFLVVDGARVPGTVLDNVPSGTVLRGATLSGVTPAVLRAGNHTAAIGLDCQGQSAAGTTATVGEAVSAVVLG